MGNKYQRDVMRGQSKISGVRCRMSVFSILHSLRSSYVWRKHSKVIINGLLEVTVFECCKNSALLSTLVILKHILVMLCLKKDMIYNRMDLCSLFVSFWLSGVFPQKKASYSPLRGSIWTGFWLPQNITNRPKSLHPADVVWLWCYSHQVWH